MGVARRSLFQSILVVALAAPFAEAGLVTWRFSGEITSVIDAEGLVSDLLSVGSRFSGEYTFESNALDALADSPGLGSYPDAVSAISGLIGELTFVGDSDFNASIAIINQPLGLGLDGYGLSVTNLSLGIPGDSASLFLNLGDTTGAAISSDALFETPPDLSLFDSATFVLTTTSERVAIRGNLTSITPEPTTLSLLALGIVALVRPQRRPSR